MGDFDSLGDVWLAEKGHNDITIQLLGDENVVKQNVNPKWDV